jgi:phosphatidylethanolamine/phosphatidyl-N-methylethanolamine N-methyltransferase
MAQVDRVTRFYNRIARIYPCINIGLKPYKKYLCKELKLLPEGSLLDIGTGHGALFGLSLKHDITGIDSSEEMLKIARKKYSDKNIQEMSAEALTFSDESYDYIVLAHVLSTAPMKKTISEAKRVLKPEGKLFILNHFTPKGRRGIISKWFARFSKYLAFSSEFKLADVTAQLNINKTEVLPADRWGFYKLIVCTKA